MAAATVTYADDALLTTKEFADYARITPECAREMRRDRRGPAYSKDGGIVRYLFADVKAWLRAKRVDPAAPAA